MSSPARVFAVLGLFTIDRPVWSPDEINEVLGYSRPTGYRYVKELVDAGLLRKVSAGRYALGTWIIELDYQLRQSDPLLLAAAPVMGALAQRTGYDAVLSALFPGPKVVDVHRASGAGELRLAYGRGRPRPLFRSAAPKVLLAALPRQSLAKLHAARAAEIAASGMGTDFAAFRAILAEIRRRGWYRSRGELERELGAMAVPVPDADGDCVGALALVGKVTRMDRESDSKLYRWLSQAAGEVTERLAEQADDAPRPPQRRDEPVRVERVPRVAR